MNCGQLCSRLDKTLDTDAYADIDTSANGLQIGSGDREIDRVAVAVDGAVETIDQAAAAEADLLVVHHGISWGGIERVTGRTYDQVTTAIENDISLYASHLPLDGHQELGNAAGVANLLGLTDTGPFGSYGGEYVGQQGQLPESTSVEELGDQLSSALDTGEGSVRVLDFGPAEIETVAIVTGSGVDWLAEAVERGADVLITGEGKQQVYHDAKESGMNVVLAGHYATETFGVRALQELLEEWGVETTYIDCPTGL